MEDNDEELVRIKVVRGDYRSTVSMDILLAKVLSERLGGEPQLKVWIQKTIELLEAKWAQDAIGKNVGERIHAKSGLSRMVQREALKFVLTIQS